MRKSSALFLITILFVTTLTMSAAEAKPTADCKFSPLDLDFTKMLSVEFGRISLSICDVVAHREKNLGYGEMAIAQGLSSISGRSLSHILHLRHDEKMGWGKIAKELGVKVSDAVHRSSSVLDRIGLSGEAVRIRIEIGQEDHDKDKDKDHGPEKNPDKKTDNADPHHDKPGNHNKPGNNPGRGNK
jgi:hypothetical protein